MSLRDNFISLGAALAFPATLLGLAYIGKPDSLVVLEDGSGAKVHYQRNSTVVEPTEIGRLFPKRLVDKGNDGVLDRTVSLAFTRGRATPLYSTPTIKEQEFYTKIIKSSDLRGSRQNASN